MYYLLSIILVLIVVSIVKRKRQLRLFIQNLKEFCNRNNIDFDTLKKEQLNNELRRIADINSISNKQDKIIARELLKGNVSPKEINLLFITDEKK